MHIVMLKRHDPLQPARKIGLLKNMAVTLCFLRISRRNRHAHQHYFRKYCDAMCIYFFICLNNVSVSMVDTISTEKLNEVVHW